MVTSDSEGEVVTGDSEGGVVTGGSKTILAKLTEVARKL